MKSCVLFVFLSLLCLAMVACRTPTQAMLPINSQTPGSKLPARARPTVTLTPAPISTGFVISDSIQVTVPTSTPTPSFAWGNFPGPSEESEIEIPPPVAPLNFPPKTVNILLLGTDRREDWTYYQTDALMILSLDPEAKRATFLSIPRDLYVYIPGWRVNRINTAEFRGGFNMIADTILYNLGIPVHHWMKVEYHQFSEAIDILGGIDVRSTGQVKDMCEGISYEYEPDVIYHMDGYDAMCYVRMRMKSSDFDRLRRQQDVFLAIFDKFISMDGFIKVPHLYDTFSQMVETDMTLKDILPLIPLGTKLAVDSSRIRFFNIDYAMVENWRIPQSGSAVLLPKREPIQAMLGEAFGDSGRSTSPHP